jgi:predicted peroxiredoxin
VAANGLPPLASLIDEFVGNGGAMWLCGACTKPRGIGDAQVAKGACIVGAARIVEAVVSGAPAVAFA